MCNQMKLLIDQLSENKVCVCVCEGECMCVRGIFFGEAFMLQLY